MCNKICKSGNYESIVEMINIEIKDIGNTMSVEKKIMIIISCHDIERTKYCCTMILWSRFQAFKSGLRNASGHKSSTLQFTCPKLCRIPQRIIIVLKDVTRVEYINFRFEYIPFKKKESYASMDKLN